MLLPVWSVPMCTDPSIISAFHPVFIPVSIFFPQSQTNATAIPPRHQHKQSNSTSSEVSGLGGPTPSISILVATPSTLFSSQPQAGYSDLLPSCYLGVPFSFSQFSKNPFNQFLKFCFSLTDKSKTTRKLKTLSLRVYTKGEANRGNYSNIL